MHGPTCKILACQRYGSFAFVQSVVSFPATSTARRVQLLGVFKISIYFLLSPVGTVIRCRNGFKFWQCSCNFQHIPNLFYFKQIPPCPNPVSVRNLHFQNCFHNYQVVTKQFLTCKVSQLLLVDLREYS